MHLPDAHGGQRRAADTWTGIRDGSEPPCRCSKPNPGPLQEQPVFCAISPPSRLVSFETVSYSLCWPQTHHGAKMALHIGPAYVYLPGVLGLQVCFMHPIHSKLGTEPRTASNLQLSYIPRPCNLFFTFVCICVCGHMCGGMCTSWRTCEVGGQPAKVGFLFPSCGSGSKHICPMSHLTGSPFLSKITHLDAASTPVTFQHSVLRVY